MNRCFPKLRQYEYPGGCLTRIGATYEESPVFDSKLVLWVATRFSKESKPFKSMERALKWLATEKNK